MGRVWGAGGRCDVDRCHLAAPGARERRGAACSDLLPDTFSPLPVNGCRSGREFGRVASARRAVARAVGGADRGHLLVVRAMGFRILCLINKYYKK